MLSLLRVVYFGLSLFTLGNLVAAPAQAALSTEPAPLVSPLQIASGSALVDQTARNICRDDGQSMD